MEVTFKKLKFGAEFMHQETLNFAVDVYVDGKQVATATNQGHGGCTMLYPTKGNTYATLQAINKHLGILPERELKDCSFTLPITLELLTDEFADNAYNQKAKDKMLKKLDKLTVNSIVYVDEAGFKTNNITTYYSMKYKNPISLLLNNEKAKASLEATVLINLDNGFTVYNPDLRYLLTTQTV